MFADFLHALMLLFFCLFLLLTAPFIAAHVADTWNAPEYPHSGFRPDSPAAENTLPPTYP